MKRLKKSVKFRSEALAMLYVAAEMAVIIGFSRDDFLAAASGTYKVAKVREKRGTLLKPE